MALSDVLLLLISAPHLLLLSFRILSYTGSIRLAAALLALAVPSL